MASEDARTQPQPTRAHSWLEDARRAAFPGSTPYGCQGGAGAERAALSALTHALRGWPESQKERDYWSYYFREQPHEDEAAILARRDDLRQLLLRALRWGYTSYPRRNFALLALANLYLLGIGEADKLKTYLRANWVLPGVRDYVQDSLLGFEGVGGDHAALTRSFDLEPEIERARIPSPKRRPPKPPENPFPLGWLAARLRERSGSSSAPDTEGAAGRPVEPSTNTAEAETLDALRDANGAFVPNLPREVVRRLKRKGWSIESATAARKAGKDVPADAKGYRLLDA